MSTILKKYFDEFSGNDRLGHAFLICNSTYDEIKDELNDIISVHFFGGKDINHVYNDLMVVKPTKSKIVKEDIINLQSEFMTKSLENLNRVYIIDEADKMNDYASNSLLKFLEEPSDNIYAFLVCKNINRILPTIKSRCHVIILEDKLSFDLSCYDEELINKSLEIVRLIEEKGRNAQPYINSLLDKNVDRDEVINIINIIKFFYYAVINNKSSLYNEFLSINKNVTTLVSKIDLFLLSRKLISINKLENMLEYNVNMNLFIDKLIYELGGSEND